MSMFMILSQFYVVDGPKQQSFQLIITERSCKLIAVPSLIASMLYAILNIVLIANLYCQIYVKNYKSFNLKEEVMLGVVLIIIISILLVLLSQDLGVSILGDCNLESQNVFAQFLVYLRGVLMIILSIILIKLQRHSPQILQTEIYKTSMDKFIRKYLHTYIKVNVSYGWLFVMSRLLIPIILNYNQNYKELINILSIIQAIMTLSMTIIRLHEPIIHRHIKYLFRPKACVLQERLLDKTNLQSEDLQNRSYQNIMIQTSGQDIIGIKLYQQQKQNQLNLSLEQYDVGPLMPQESTQIQQIEIQNIIEHSGHNEIILLLQASYEMLEDHQYCQNSEMTYYQFNKIQQRSIQINQTKHILVTTYGQDILSLKVRDYFGINLKQIKNSLDISLNIDNLRSQELPQKGTLFITHDNLISIEFITRDQKRQLTKGSGLQLLWQRWDQEYTCALGIFLPVIFGVHSFYLNGNYFTIVFKLNRLRLKYPLLEELWSHQAVLNNLIKQNIIGWITIENGVYNKRFLAQEVKDGKFNIVFNKNDYLLDENDKYSLMDMIRRDYATMQQMKCSFTLQFVYTKHTSARLDSLAGKEKQFDQDQSVAVKHRKKTKHFIGNIASFELKTKLGFVQVFWDDCWKYYQSDIEKLIQIVNDNF
ncbi:unnamed protein product (macronuclear) [Paramecium tetraurelia]|uniref:Transmembrane protein n=1 Tax=Paramecium tetraurelia TaxID=5888 RepID=A0BH58_PARTE|nr:uncharacterized protein GSPATT00028910001 [Paramecium tetraurelia]CAK57875.1 unnamed protein product [Paramecium tetraurelia]|eukprot:XP_001425273.1 hypothetical protein (macronuclear) [Paramecium tetraurelia strain d4-2]